MWRYRIRASAAALLLIALAAPLTARADDYGPSVDIAAIRHDLPIVQKRSDLYHDFIIQTVTIESVVADGATALAQFQDSQTNYRQIVLLNYKFDRWWLDYSVFYGNSDDIAACPPASAPTPEFLARRDVPSALVTLAAKYMPIVQEAIVMVRQFAENNPGLRCGVSSIGDRFYSPLLLPFQTTYRRGIDGGNIYEAMIKLAQNDGDERSAIANIHSRAPTEAESWVTPGGNSYFFFSAAAQSAQPVHVQAGTTIDVWFPFVLDPSLQYRLTIKGTGLGYVAGTFADNTLRFSLPAFKVEPGVALEGEVKGVSSNR